MMNGGEKFDRRWLVSQGASYLLTLFATALTTAALYPFQTQVNSSVIALLYLLPVGLSATIWGLGPGIMASLASFLALNYFFITPYYSLSVHHTQDLISLVVFLTMSVGISQLVGRARKGQAEAMQREREAIWLYELSTRLTGSLGEREIVHTITEHVLTTFQAEKVEVVVEPKGDSLAAAFSLQSDLYTDDPEGAPAEKPSLVVPLQTATGLLGEIHVWRTIDPITPVEERLLRTFASQGVLALERARLAHADTRARVLEESDRFKSSLLSSVSHELRTPLATIKAAVTSLSSDTVPWDTEARAELLEVIEEETDHLNLLVGNLLNMARIDAGALQPQKSWNSLNEIVLDALNRIRLQTQQHQVDVDLPEELPLVPVDYLQIEQVLTNLISNSVKYSPENTVIRIQAGLYNEDALIVTVSNQGPPVAEEHLQRIFDKFYRVTDAERVTGSGLGLSICKGIVEAHGGRIWAENLTDGFAFNFTLPLTWEGLGKGAKPRLPIQ
jgi:two-component system sensor histidine kinase KdpD